MCIRDSGGHCRSNRARLTDAKRTREGVRRSVATVNNRRVRHSDGAFGGGVGSHSDCLSNRRGDGRRTGNSRACNRHSVIARGDTNAGSTTQGDRCAVLKASTSNCLLYTSRCV